MSTSGYLIEYDHVAFQRHVQPLAGKDAGTIVAALESHPDSLLWDDETREFMEEADDADELIRRAFSAWCVPANAEPVCLGRSVTLQQFARLLEPLDATGALQKAFR